MGIGGFALSQEKPGRKESLAPARQISTSATNAQKTSDFRVIGYIEKRDRTITIKSGPKGTVYSVKTPEGKVLFENLSAEQLRARAPELHEFIKTAVAGGNKIDARIKVDAIR